MYHYEKALKASDIVWSVSISALSNLVKGVDFSDLSGAAVGCL